MKQLKLYRVHVTNYNYSGRGTPKFFKFSSHKVFGINEEDALRIANKYKIGYPIGCKGKRKITGEITIEDAIKRKGKWFSEKDNKLIDLRPYT